MTADGLCGIIAAMKRLAWGVGVLPLLLACGSSSSRGTNSSGGAAGTDAGSAGSGGSSGSGGTSSTGGAAGSTSGGSGGTSTGGAAGSGGSGGQSTAPPSASDLLALLKNCQQVSTGLYSTDSNTSATVPVCQLNGAVYWRADMDVDCDGLTSTQCNSNTDPWYQAQTAATDSQGKYLDAAKLPYVVVPGVSSRFSYKTAGLHFGSIIAVIYKGKVTYGVFGDIGPTSIIGEASYAMAASLGINPDPAVGGADSGVTYIAFTGQSGVAPVIEDHSATTTQGEQQASQLVQAN